MAFGVPKPQDGMVPFASLQAPEASQGVASNFGPLAQAMDAPTLQAKPKVNWLGVLADALAGAAGRQGPYASMLMQQRQQDQEDQRFDRRQQSELETQKSLYLWKQLHETPAPTEYERALAAAGIMPGSPEYIQHMGKYVQMKESPIWNYTDPATGAIMLGTKSAPIGPQILDTLPPGATPIGGPSPSGSGGFR